VRGRLREIRGGGRAHVRHRRIEGMAKAMKLRNFMASDAMWREVMKRAKREKISAAEFVRRAVTKALAEKEGGA